MLKQLLKKFRKRLNNRTLETDTYRLLHMNNKLSIKQDK